MGGRGTSSGINGNGRRFTQFSEAQTFFGVGQQDGMFPEWERSLSAAERKAAVYYTTEAYKEINKWLRGAPGYDPAQTPDKIKATAAGVEAAADKFNLTENITVWRGGSNKLVGGASSLAEIKAMIGAVVQDNGIMSTAMTPSGMWGTTGGNIGYEIEVPKGRGRGFFVDPISDHKGEQEFTLKPGTQFRITGAYTDTHGHVICKMKILAKKIKS